MSVIGGECSVCCGTCGCKAGTKLPYTMTVTFDGLPSKQQWPNCVLAITSNFGGGASGVAVRGGGCHGSDDPACVKAGSGCPGKTKSYHPSDLGPLQEVLLLDGGSGYAKIGRSPPTLSASAGAGRGAVFSVQQEMECDKLKFHNWSVKSISVTGGDGYEHGSPVTLSCKSDDICVREAAGVLHTSPRVQPDLKCSADGGIGASLVPQLSATAWGVDAVNAKNGGSKYVYGDSVKIDIGKGDVQVASAGATIKTKLTEPVFETMKVGGTMMAECSRKQPRPSYENAQFTPTFEKHTTPQGKNYWSISSLEIVYAGSEHYVGDTISPPHIEWPNVEERPVVAHVSAVGGQDGGVTEVAICDGGKYYRDSGVAVSAAVSQPGAYYHDDEPRTPPSLSASIPYPSRKGSGATLDVSLRPVEWGVASVSVESGGTGYKYGQPVTTSAGEFGFTNAACVAFAKTTLVAPSVTATACRNNGRGALLTPSLAQNYDADGVPYWYVDSISVTAGGSGYVSGDGVTISVTSGVQRRDSVLRAAVSGVDNKTGSIQEVAVLSGGKMHRDTGVIESVAVKEPGAYYKYTGTPIGVTVTDGGKYYKEDPEAAPYVADVDAGVTWSPFIRPPYGILGHERTSQGCCRAGYNLVPIVSVDQTLDPPSGPVTEIGIDYACECYTEPPPVVIYGQWGSGATAEAVLDDSGRITSINVTNGGSGYLDGVFLPEVSIAPIEGTRKPCGLAKISATVDSKLSSETFGEITGLKIDDGGDCYLPWRWTDTCLDRINGKSFVLRADDPTPLVTLSATACSSFPGGGGVQVRAVGDRSEPEVKIRGNAGSKACGGDNPAKITPTLEKVTSPVNEYLFHWTLESVDASGGSLYADGKQATVTVEQCATVGEPPEVILHATPITQDENGKNVGGELTGADVTNGGQFVFQGEYTNAPGPIKIVPGIGKGATAVAKIDEGSGRITGFEVTSGGSAYQNPILSLSSGGDEDKEGVPPEAYAVHKDLNGTITKITLQGGYPGGGYKAAPDVRIIDYVGGKYALLGRQEPSLAIKTAESTTGSGVEFTPTLEKTSDFCGIDYWYIKSVAVSGGECYGVRGRGAVSLKATATPGSGATFRVTTDNAKDDCGGDYWYVDSISVKGGCGYEDGGNVTLTATEGATVRVAAKATIQTKRDVPTLTAKTSGATFDVSYGGSDPWSVAGLSVKSIQPCARFQNGQPVIFALGKCDVEASPASVVVQTVVTKVDGVAKDTGVFSGVKIISGGAYYKEGIPIGVEIQAPGEYFVKPDDELLTVSLSTDDDKEATKARLSLVTDDYGSPIGVSIGGYDGVGANAVAEINNDGQVSKVSLLTEGARYSLAPVVVVSGGEGSGAKVSAKADINGAIKSVTLDSGGSGYTSPPTISFTNHGAYYRVSKTLPPYVADVTIEVSQKKGSNGSKAKITATVDDDPYSSTFGQIDQVTIEDHGDGYTFFGGPQGCSYGGGCRHVISHNYCRVSGPEWPICSTPPPFISLAFHGADKAPEVTLRQYCPDTFGCAKYGYFPPDCFHSVFRATENTNDCKNPPSKTTVLYGSDGGKATISYGGEWQTHGSPCKCSSSGEDTDTCTGECNCDGDCEPGCKCNEETNQCERKCSGPCECNSDCAPGCKCVDGQCAEAPCTNIVQYAGDTLTFSIGEACSGEVFNNDPEGQAEIAKQWMDSIAQWMNANGYADATGGAVAPTGPSCTACDGPDYACDLWPSVLFDVGACCDGVQATDFGPDWLDVFGDVFPGQDPPFYWQSFSGSPFIPPCIPNELP